MSNGKKVTSPKVAATGSRLLKSKTSSRSVKSVSGSVLVQAEKPKKAPSLKDLQRRRRGKA